MVSFSGRFFSRSICLRRIFVPAYIQSFLLADGGSFLLRAGLPVARKANFLLCFRRGFSAFALLTPLGYHLIRLVVSLLLVAIPVSLEDTGLSAC